MTAPAIGVEELVESAFELSCEFRIAAGGPECGAPADWWVLVHQCARADCDETGCAEGYLCDEHIRALRKKWSQLGPNQAVVCRHCRRTFPNWRDYCPKEARIR